MLMLMPDSFEGSSMTETTGEGSGGEVHTGDFASVHGSASFLPATSGRDSSQNPKGRLTVAEVSQPFPLRTGIIDELSGPPAIVHRPCFQFRLPIQPSAITLPSSSGDG